MKISVKYVIILFTFFLLGCSAEETAVLPPTSTPTPVPTATPPPTPTPEWYREGWDLVWQDEFDGPDIDLEKWSHEVNGRGGGNNELQYYTDFPENSFIEDGNLVIEAREERYIGRSYTSARMRTLGKGDWQYGRFEARIKLPTGQGLWPAFWMLPSEWRYGGWPSSGEIDIMELVGHEPDTVHGTIHFGGLGNHLYTGKPFSLDAGIFNDDFYIFAVEWEEREMRWYIDDEHYLTQNSWSTRNADYPAPFDQPFHIILNVAVGGNWPGSPDETTVFPQRMEVDYVRVYQRPSDEQ
ncbi:MAG: glycoside hydrolase family 16 protein [Chloroflexota bacterium]